jgi:monoamine oxidase
MNDYIIIGCGIAGLYSAYNIRKKYSNAKITILEKERIGGRMGLKDFYGAQVPIGAGVGREHDILLLNLLQELNISVKKIPDNSFLTFKGVNILTAIKVSQTMDASDAKGNQLGINLNTSQIKLTGYNNF